jgi:uncharacterized protein (DUF1499 family)
MGKASQEMKISSSYKDGRLINCPDKPNCVSSFSAPTDSHYIAPIKYKASKVKNIGMYLKSINCDELEVSLEKGYFHYICKSKVFGFVDDIELVFDQNSELLHFRSGSRVGHSDLDANRKRVEQLKVFLTAH